MSLSTKPASCRIHLVAGGSGTHPKVVKRLTLPSLQRVKPELRKSLKASSRREIVHFAASSLGFLCLLLPQVAEARPKNADIRKKILDKLQQLREKAGLSNPKVEGQEKIPTDRAEEIKSTPKTKGEEKNDKPTEESEENKSASRGGLHFPLPSLLNDKVVETNLSS